MSSLEPVQEEEGSRLSNPELLRVEATKVTDYLLSSDHPKGAAKAKFFKGVGFSVKGKNGPYSPVTGPLQVRVVLGGAAESMVGQCAEQIFTPLQCTVTATKVKCK